MRVLVCGGRGFDEWRTVAKALDEMPGITLVIHGGARGADSLAGKWAQTRNVPECVFPANWRCGKKAGVQRNAAMLQHGHPDVVVAFPGGVGTADMVRRSREAGVLVLERGGDGRP